MGYKVSSNNPLAYMGVEPTTPAQFVVFPKDPTPNNINFNLGTQWLNSMTQVPWILVNLAGGKATWIKFAAGSFVTETLTTEDAVVVPPTAGNINILGGTGIFTTGNAGTSTVTINADASVPTTFESGNDSSTATPAGNVITFLGTGGTDITASGSVVTVSSGGSSVLVSTLTGNSGGPIFPLAGNINVVGDGTTASVVGTPSSHELTISVLSSPTSTNSFITSPATGTATPVAGVITVAGTGDTTVSAAGSTLTISSTGGGSGTTEFLSGNNASTATPSAGIITFTGASGNTVTAAGSTVTITGSGSNPTTSFVTSPATGTVTPASGVVTIAGAGDTTVTGSGSTLTISSTGGGGSGITTIDGNIGSITGSTVTISVPTTGSGGAVGIFGTVQFIATSATESNLYFSDPNSNVMIASGQTITGPGAFSGTNNTIINTNTYSLSFGSYNTLIGQLAGQALFPTSTPPQAFYNTFIGFQAGSGCTTGANNIAIGAASGSGIATGNNNIVIGGLGSGGGANSTAIGNSGTTSAYISGISGNPQSGSAVNIATNLLGIVVSSKRFKNNIEEMGVSSEDIFKLRPVTFTWNKDSSPGFKNDPGLRQFGLIAEEVEEIMPQIVSLGEDKKPLSINYQDLVAPLLNELKKLKDRVDVLESKFSP